MRNTGPAFFPGGLIQPPGSFRFSLDALLLASFAARRLPGAARPSALLDLGCGCGVVGLACLLLREDFTARGADREAELVAAARDNAALLGLERRFTAVSADLADAESRAALAAEKADIVTANMPYRREGEGRLPRSPLRRRALFAEPGTVPAFMLAAAAALKPGGRFDLVYPWGERERLFAALSGHGFFPECLLPVSTGGAEPALCLVSARREPAALCVEETLLLRPEGGGPYTREARAFCPWLDG